MSVTWSDAAVPMFPAGATVQVDPLDVPVTTYLSMSCVSPDAFQKMTGRLLTVCTWTELTVGRAGTTVTREVKMSPVLPS